MAGDEATGYEGVMPHSRYPRGAEGQRQATQRILQPQLVIPQLRPLQSAATLGPVNYALLHCIDVRSGVVRAELSIPADHDKSGRVTEWGKRILLPNVQLGGNGNVSAIPQPSPTPVIQVRRRQP